jgi:hypothetical protein
MYLIFNMPCILSISHLFLFWALGNETIIYSSIVIFFCTKKGSPVHVAPACATRIIIFFAHFLIFMLVLVPYFR